MGGGALIVLDTHAAIWYAGGVSLSRAAISAIESAVPESGVLLSAISAWEIGMLIAKKRLIVDGSAETYVRALFHRDGVVEEPVSKDIAIYAALLPFEFHGNPADRLIVATAAILSIPLVTRDQRILAYLRKTKLTAAVAC